MTFDLSRLSPQGWAFAVSILACGVAIPFMRSKHGREGSHEPAMNSTEVAADHPNSSSVTDSKPQSSAADKSQARANSFQLPSKGTIPSPLSAASAQATAPEFPNWARKPSPLDELMESNGHSPINPEVDPNLRKPSPFRTWSGDAEIREHTGEFRKGSPDRHTPFHQQDPLDTAPPAAIAHVVWPDHEISGLSAAEYAATPTRPAAELVGAKNSKAPPGALSEPPMDAGFDDHPRKNRTVGAALRSQVVPSRELFICQPGVSP